MKSRLTILGVTIVLAISFWLAHSRRPATAPLSVVAARSADDATSKNIGPETSEQTSVSENLDRESDPHSSTPIGPVTPPPRAQKLAALEEPPVAPTPAMPSAPSLGPTEAAAGAESHPQATAPATVLENVRSAFRSYATRFGGNPVGDNAEITAALNGGNAGHVVFINQDDDGLHVRSDGQLVDSWGTPLFFHQLSRTEMEIRSAGPDRKMWTTDDLIFK